MLVHSVSRLAKSADKIDGAIMVLILLINNLLPNVIKFIQAIKLNLPDKIKILINILEN